MQSTREENIKREKNYTVIFRLFADDQVVRLKEEAHSKGIVSSLLFYLKRQKKHHF